MNVSGILLWHVLIGILLFCVGLQVEGDFMLTFIGRERELESLEREYQEIVVLL
ncbi:MAG: hypothetical protein ACLKAO_07785 [Alkaliphilus sp.]